ncbi:4Fe-4S binding protein, partial [Citrobacter freundii]
IRNAWCRYLCPYGALLGLFSLFSPFKIRRNADSCIDCGKCAKNCPSNIPVDRLIQVRTVECTGCMTCVESCPVASTLSFSLQTPPGAQSGHSAAPTPWWRQGRLSGWTMTLLLLGILFAAVGYAVYANVWQTPVPDHMYFQLIPKARMIGH